MNILYTCDNNYIWIMGISMISLFENNKAQEHLKVYLLGDRISDDNRKILKQIANRYSRECIVIDVPELKIPDVLISTRWPISAFTRLFSGILMPEEIEKVLYLDCDTIIKQNISDIWNIDMKDNIFYGVKDCIGKKYKENVGIDGDGVYINAGVLLINLDRLRKIAVLEEIDKYLSKYKSYINYADQDILNGIFSSKIGVLKPEYNVMTLISVYDYDEVMNLRFPTNYYTKNEIEKCETSPKVIHYTTCMLNVRPWFLNTNHPHAKEFFKYMKLSPWKNSLLDTFEFNSKNLKVVSIIQKLPDKVANRILGLIHAKLKPLYIRYKAEMKG